MAEGESKGNPVKASPNCTYGHVDYCSVATMRDGRFAITFLQDQVHVREGASSSDSETLETVHTAIASFTMSPKQAESLASMIQNLSSSDSDD